MTDEHGIGGGIGATLRDARRRQGLEIKQVEEQTKIRARYLRALENEDWGALPAPVYVRGFLRTYGQQLGLDGELLADEYRRSHEEEPTPGPPASEPVLSGRRRQGERPPSRGPLIGMVAVAIVALLLILGLFGGGGDSDGGGDGANAPARQDGGSGSGAKKQQQEKKKAAKKAKPEPKVAEDAVLTAITAVEVCLVAGKDSALIDRQVLSAGTIESFEGVKNYRLDVSAGSVQFVVGKEKQRIEATEPVSYEGDSRGIRPVTYKGPECP